MVLRSQRDGWAAPGTQTPYKRDRWDTDVPTVGQRGGMQDLARGGTEGGV